MNYDHLCSYPNPSSTIPVKVLNIPDIKKPHILIFSWYVSQALYPELKNITAVSGLNDVFALSDLISGPQNIKKIKFSKFKAEN